jgi:hypothetical protein
MTAVTALTWGGSDEGSLLGRNALGASTSGELCIRRLTVTSAGDLHVRRLGHGPAVPREQGSGDAGVDEGEGAHRDVA